MRKKEKKENKFDVLDDIKNLVDKSDATITISEAASMLRAVIGFLHEKGELLPRMEKRFGKINSTILFTSMLTSYYLSLYNHAENPTDEEIDKITEPLANSTFNGEFVLVKSTLSERNGA